MLTEDAVIDAVIDYLQGHDYQVTSRASVREHGHDLVAERSGGRLIIEAKGAGSSKKGTSRFGLEFTSSQVFTHVAKAVLKALRVVHDGHAWSAIALPDTPPHRKEIDQVESALRTADVGVFWVDERGEVELDAPWDLSAPARHQR